LPHQTPERISCPYLSTKVTIAIPLLAAIQFSFVLFVFLRTACTDPGILPRSERDEVLYNERQALAAMDTGNGDPPTQMINNTQMPRVKEVRVKDRTVKLKVLLSYTSI
jgi:palmitoyltransferase ZDHHC9/14/18